MGESSEIPNVVKTAEKERLPDGIMLRNMDGDPINLQEDEGFGPSKINFTPRLNSAPQPGTIITTIDKYREQLHYTPVENANIDYVKSVFDPKNTEGMEMDKRTARRIMTILESYPESCIVRKLSDKEYEDLRSSGYEEKRPTELDLTQQTKETYHL